MRSGTRPIRGECREREARGSAGERVGHVAVGFVALAVVPVLGLNSLATADTGDTGAASAADGQRHPRPALTDAQRQCLAEQGVTLPTRRGDGTRPAAHRGAARSPERRGRGLWSAPHAAAGPRSAPVLTDAQRQCLAEQGVTCRPVRPTAPRRVRSPSEQRAALRAARRGVRPAHRPASREDRYEGVIGRARLRVAHVEPPPRQLFHLADGGPQLVAERPGWRSTEDDG